MFKTDYQNALIGWYWLSVPYQRLTVNNIFGSDYRQIAAFNTFHKDLKKQRYELSIRN